MRQRFIVAALCSCLVTALLLFYCGRRPASNTVDATPPTVPAAAPGGARLAQLAASPGARLDIEPALDTDRTVRRVLSSEGGSLQTSAADGSTFVLTIPPNALLDEEEIALTPVSNISGLPPGVTLAAAVQMSPDGLMLFEPAVLTIQPARSVPADQEITFGWSGRGEAMHAYPVSPRSKTAEFHLMHFSGAGVAAGSASAAQPIVKAPAAPCNDLIFSRVEELLRRARLATLRNEDVRMEDFVAAYAAASRTYLDEVLKPLVSEAARDEAIFPCVVQNYIAWYRSGQLYMGADAFSDQQGSEAQALGDALWRAPLSNVFEKSYSRCMKGESPVFQSASMGSLLRHLAMMGQEDLTPPRGLERFLECSQQVTFLVDVESQMSNVYNVQGQGADVASSVTRLEARGIVASYDEARSRREKRPVYTGNPVPAKATVSVVWRNRCPNQARVEPGASLGVVVKPIVNPRVGQLRCEGGKPRCQPSNMNPGAMVGLAPIVTESTYLHTETGSGQCIPANYWNEFMMFSMGGMSVGSDSPFQVPGTGAQIVRRGASVRRVPVNVLPQIRAMHPKMKDYVEISTPAIETAVEQTRVTITTKRR